MEKSYLKTLIKESGGSWETACKLSGLSKTRLYELLKKYNLSLSDSCFKGI
jgi:two-component system NtrC family response regulator